MIKKKRKKKGSDESLPHPTGKPGTCISCGKKTDETATIYLGKQFRGDDGSPHVEWKPYTRELCHECAEESHDSNLFRSLLYVALQVCWVPLFSHGITPIGIGGAAIATYSLYKIVQAIADHIWHRRAHTNQAEEPLWMREGETPEQIASDCLKELSASELGEQGFAIETLREHQRHAKA